MKVETKTRKMNTKEGCSVKALGIARSQGKPSRQREWQAQREHSGKGGGTVWLKTRNEFQNI